MDLVKTLLKSNLYEETIKYTEEIESTLESVPVVVKTSHPILSALLTQELHTARKSGIDYKINVTLTDNIKVSPMDLCVILGNLFDNAFEACSNLPDESDRYIDLGLFQKNTSILVEMKNTYKPNIKLRNRTGIHGYGMKNIKKTLEKYGGYLDIKTEKDIFYVSIIIL